LNGELVSHTTYMETKSRPHFVHAVDGQIAVHGGMADVPLAPGSANQLPKLSERPEGD
jgi:hypothetical protein